MPENEEARCAFCGMPIIPEDASAQCSFCGKPYHTVCWMLNSRCVTPDCPGELMNQREGTVRTVPGASPQTGETGSGRPADGSVFIPVLKQGALQTETPAAVPEEQIDEELLNRFFGENQAYYRSAFRKMKKQKPIVWNWVAFMVPGFWMVFRKMYVYGGALLGLNLLLLILLPKVYPVFVLLQAAAAGMFGNLLYKFDIGQRLKKAQTLSGAEQQTYLKHSCGTQKVIAYVSAGLFAVLAIILMILTR